ncbi:MAG TPA: hypothetical protein VGB76_10460, partial [Pyrinomonadaceae bacterium]
MISNGTVKDAGNAASEGEAASPRLSRLYALAAVLALAGLADAVYLTVEHLTGRSVRCTVTSG